MNYAEFIPLLVKSIQELSEENKQLKEDIKELSKKVDQLFQN